MLTKADDIIRFLDTGYYVMLRKNALGTYSAGLVNCSDLGEDGMFEGEEYEITDAPTPSEALYLLADKLIKRPMTIEEK